MHFLFLGFVFHAAVSQDTEWKAGFGAAKEIGALQANALVVAAVVDPKLDQPELDDVSRALQAALRSNAKVKHVLAQKGFSGADDAAAVKRLSILAVDLVLTLRLFDTTAVVAIYDKQGNAKGGFSVEKHGPQARTSDKAGGVIGRLLDEPKAQDPTGGTGNSEYDKQFLYEQEWLGINQYGNVVATWSTIYQGKYKRPVDGAEFYEIVGRQDLATRYRERRALRISFYSAGGVGLLGGAAAMLGGLAVLGKPTCTRYGYDASAQPGCLESDPLSAYTPFLITGGIAMGAGLIATVIAACISPQPISAPEARELLDGYNQRLKEKMGVEKTSAFTIDLSPSFGPGTMGFAASGTF